MKTAFTKTKKGYLLLRIQLCFNLAKALRLVCGPFEGQQTSLCKLMKISGLIFFSLVSPVNKTRAANHEFNLTVESTVTENNIMDGTHDLKTKTFSHKTPLVTYLGEITGRTPDWEYLTSEAGKMVVVPFEGRYESKGGRIRSLWIDLDKAVGQPAYYRLQFTAKTSVSCY